MLYNTEQAVALAKMMEVAALDFKAALKKERAAERNHGQSSGRDDEGGIGTPVKAAPSNGGSDSASLSSSPMSVESRDTDEGTDDDSDGGGHRTGDADSDELSILNF